MPLNITWQSTRLKQDVTQRNAAWPNTFQTFVQRATTPDYNPQEYLFVTATIMSTVHNTTDGEVDPKGNHISVNYYTAQKQCSAARLYVRVSGSDTLTLKNVTFKTPRVAVQENADNENENVGDSDAE